MPWQINQRSQLARSCHTYSLLQIGHFTKADPAYGRGVAEALGVTVPQEEVAITR